MRKPLRLLLPLLLVALALTACYEPLEYELVINVSDTGAYEMSFDGTIGAYLITQAELDGTPPEELEAMVSEASGYIEENPTVTASEYRGGGIFYVRGTQSFSSTDMGVIFDLSFLDVTREPGRMTFASWSFGEETQEQFDHLGYKHDGHVILRTSASIIESNGKQGPRGHYWDKELIEREGVRITIATP